MQFKITNVRPSPLGELIAVHYSFVGGSDCVIVPVGWAREDVERAVAKDIADKKPVDDDVERLRKEFGL